MRGEKEEVSLESNVWSGRGSRRGEMGVSGSRLGQMAFEGLVKKMSELDREVWKEERLKNKRCSQKVT